MENATKALLMAGGILLGLIILAGLVLMWTNISKFQANNSAEKEDQIKQFNEEFTTYVEDKGYIRGVDIISLFNKVESYDKTNPEFFNSKVQYEPIKIKVQIKNNYSAVSTGIHEITGNGNRSDTLNRFITENNSLENDYGRDFLVEVATKLISIKGKYDPTPNSKTADPELIRYLNSKGATTEDSKFRYAVAKILGRTKSKTNVDITTDSNFTVNNIEKYRRYTEFKTAKFDCEDPQYNENGQISILSFKEQ